MSLGWFNDDARDPPEACPVYGCVSDGPGDGIKWKTQRYGGALKWSYVPDGAPIDQRAFMDATRRCFDDWRVAFPLDFNYTANLDDAHIVLGWYHRDGAGNILAEAQLPVWDYPRVSRAWFDRDEAWNVSVDFETVCLHELGHILGLRHLSFPDAVMYWQYTRRRHALSQWDINALRAIYYAKKT